ncbi:hypothetical protein [Prevotella intermedia]|uniref:hypothetical protein n=1 Tax=Prevotella intermedia TaxID=28131 RepID=UPI001E4EF6C2|nr:hypothetical protein [Prevotella intermedia]
MFIIGMANGRSRLSLQSLIEEGVVEAEKDNIVFQGSCPGRYRGLEVSLEGLLSNDYNTKVVSVNWTGKGIEIEITTDIYQERDCLGDNLWKDKNNR